MALARDELQKLEAELISMIDAAADIQALDAVRVSALGKKGTISALLKSLGAMSAQDRQDYGPLYNGLKEAMSARISGRRDVLEAAAMNAALVREHIDVTLPLASEPLLDGRIHPISQTLDTLISIFADMGFDLAEGPDIETEHYNFTALNIPETHPARQMHDTFYLKAEDEKNASEQYLLRTHTSPVQIRTMEQGAPPFRFVAPGRTYRCDSDQTHTPMFHQIEGLVIDEGTHLGHLKWTLRTFLEAFFGVRDLRLRFRASYFPFTEPSMEIDVPYHHDGTRLVVGSGDKWLELGGCGMVHPRVLAHAGVDGARYQGFAFGMGIDRLAMLKYGMPDLRAFFDSDLRWLKHYGFVPLDMVSVASRLSPARAAPNIKSA